MNLKDKTTHYFIPLCTLIFCLTLAGCKEKKDQGKKNDEKKDKPVMVDVVVAVPKSLINILEANGTVIPNESTELRPEVSGRLTYLNVPEGKSVTQGTILARTNSADLQAQIARTKVQLETATKTEERLKKLLDINGINLSDYDAAVNTVNTLKADIAYTQTLVDKTVIRAPFSGTIGLRQVSPGAYITPTTVIATLQQLGRMKIDFTIPEENSGLVSIGRTVDVKLDGQSGETKKATIIALEPQANLETRNLNVRAVLENTRANPGAFVKVLVNNNSKKAIMIPANAIIPDDRNSQVILVKEGKAFFVNVSTGVRTDNNVEITEGVSVGDSVVVTGVLFAKPKAKLKVRKVLSL